MRPRSFRLQLESLDRRVLPSFSIVIEYPVSPSPRGITTADFNNDGRLDLAVANVNLEFPTAESSVSILLGVGDGAFQEPLTVAADTLSWSLLAGDLNGDARVDLVTVNQSSIAPLSVSLGNGDGTFGLPQTVALPEQIPPRGDTPLPQTPSAAALGDLNGDGVLDLVAAGWTFIPTENGETHGYLNVLLGIGDGSFATRESIPNEYGGIVLRDFDGDGRTDVVTGGGLYVRVLRGNGDGTLQGAQQSRVNSAWFMDISTPVGDFDSDGKLDLLMRDGSGGSAVPVLGNGDGTFRVGESVPTSTTIHSIVVGDVNADGTLDIVVADSGIEYGDCGYYGCYDPVSTRTARVLLGHGDGSFGQPIVSDLGTFPTLSAFFSAALGDFDGDGRLDLATSDYWRNSITVGRNDGVWQFPPVPPSVTFGDVTLTEGNTGTQTANFPVTLSAATSLTVTINYVTTNGTATAGSDFAPITGTLTFAAGETSKLIRVPVYGDLVNEPDEIFYVYLTSTTNARVVDRQAIGTILDDDPLLSIQDVNVTEGNTGTRAAHFNVALSNPAALPATVEYATADGTASAGVDYQAASGTLMIPAGQTTGTITVLVNGDRLAEPDETFVVKLSNPVNALVASGSGIATIRDDEPLMSIQDVTVTEGNVHRRAAHFTVALSTTSDQPVTVTYATADSTASAGSDYRSASGTLTILAGHTTGTLSVLVYCDRVGEPNETFFVNLSGPVNSGIADGQAVATIGDDEPRISITDVTRAERGWGHLTLFTFTVTLSAAYDRPVKVLFHTANGTARAEEDYAFRFGTFTFAAGQTRKTITIMVKGDARKESDENFFVDLTGITDNMWFNKNRGVGTILNDD